MSYNSIYLDDWHPQPCLALWMQNLPCPMFIRERGGGCISFSSAPAHRSFQGRSLLFLLFSRFCWENSVPFLIFPFFLLLLPSKLSGRTLCTTIYYYYYEALYVRPYVQARASGMAKLFGPRGLLTRTERKEGRKAHQAGSLLERECSRGRPVIVGLVE